MESRENLKRDTTPLPSYYKNWDKIDVDAELQKLETGESLGFDSTLTTQGEKIEKPHFPNQPQPSMALTSGAAPNTKLLVKGGVQLSSVDHVLILKDKGNAHVKLQEYGKAADLYSQALSMQFINRELST